jgi:predicted transcriptional regulator YdeE
MERDARNARMPMLWQRFYDQAMPARLSANHVNGRVVGVYSGYESGAKGQYTVTAGVQMRSHLAKTNGLDVVSVSPGEYLRFSCYGQGPQAVAGLWADINEFFVRVEHPLAGAFDRAYTADFERYGDPDCVSIFVAVKRKLGVDSISR